MFLSMLLHSGGFRAQALSRNVDNSREQRMQTEGTSVGGKKMAAARTRARERLAYK